jgi:hypothetical protein
MFLQAEDFTKLLELCSLRNSSRLVVNMAIMRKATVNHLPLLLLIGRWTAIKQPL